MSGPTTPGLYLADGGACYCLNHLGTNARFTGRDISGQPIDRVRPEDDIYMAREFGLALTCETCGADRAMAESAEVAK